MKRLEFKDSHSTSSSLHGDIFGSYFDRYMAQHGRLLIGGKAYRHSSTVQETNVLTRTIKVSIAQQKQAPYGELYIVRLGGPFEEVGEENEAIGGDNQKVG